MLPTTLGLFRRLPCTSSFPLFAVKPGASKNRLQCPWRDILGEMPWHGNYHALLRMPELTVASPGRLQSPADSNICTRSPTFTSNIVTQWTERRGSTGAPHAGIRRCSSCDGSRGRTTAVAERLRRSTGSQRSEELLRGE